MTTTLIYIIIGGIILLANLVTVMINLKCLTEFYKVRELTKK